MRRFWIISSAAFLSVLLVATLAATSLAEKGGKGNGGGGSDPPPAPINYELTWLGNLGGNSFLIRDINNWGQIVGRGTDENGTLRAFVLTPADKNGDGIAEYFWDADFDGVNDLLVDINNMVDANGQPTVPAGWRANRATSVNDAAEVTGTLWDGNTRAVYSLDLITQTMQIIDIEGPGGAPPILHQINDLGEIAYTKVVNSIGLVHLYVPSVGITNLQIQGRVVGTNNAGEIFGLDDSGMGTGFRYTPGQDLQFVNTDAPLTTYSDVNSSGSFVGRYTQSPRSKGAYRHSDDKGLELLTDKAKSADAFGINLEGDVCLQRNGGGRLFTDQHGLLDLDNLVIGANDDLAAWFLSSIEPRQINDRDVTGFGQICGAGTIDGISVGFVLTPVPAATP